MHKALFAATLTSREAITAGTLSLEDTTDVAFLARQLRDLADDARKELHQVYELAERIACLRWVTENMNELSPSPSIRTRLCVATPDVKQMASLPRPTTQPKEYEALMSHLGVPKDSVAFGILRPHWPAFADYLTDLGRLGKPLPPGITPDKTYPVYKLTIRKCHQA